MSGMKAMSGMRGIPKGIVLFEDGTKILTIRSSKRKCILKALLLCVSCQKHYKVNLMFSITAHTLITGWCPYCGKLPAVTLEVS